MQVEMEGRGKGRGKGRTEGRKRFECDVCLRVFSRLVSLNEHKYIHSNVKPFECRVCGQTFRQNSNYNKHLKLHQNQSQSQSQGLGCGVCGRVFSTQSYLKSHLVSHNDFKSCLCDVCGNAFKYRSDLVRHLKIHDNQRQHKCNVCRLGFNDISALTRHRIKVHKNNSNSVGPIGNEGMGETWSAEQMSRDIRIDTNLEMRVNWSDSDTKSANESNQSIDFDLNDSNYVNSVIDYIDVCRILPVPLPNHIFSKLIDIQKEIGIHLGIDKKCRKEFSTALRTCLQDLNAIINEDLNFKYKIIQ